ncbi:MAG: hypothetical protein M3R18_02170, partial [Pseudomonadota bacterium]|nr:hypothetical protein [Pseudomonadota bacterium]
MIATAPVAWRKTLTGLLTIFAGLSFPATTFAQTTGLQPSGPVPAAPILGPSAAANPGASLLAPSVGTGTGTFQQRTRQLPPQLAPPAAAPPQAAPTSQAAPNAPAGQVALYLSARFGRDLPQIASALQWRIYADIPDPAGTFRLLKEERTAAPAFVLPAGSYVVHVSFGQASAAKRIELRSETVREVFEIPAGGIRLEGRVGDVRIPGAQISFDIYKGSQFEPGDKRPLTQGILTGDVMLVPEGTYTIVSNYGDGNAVVRSDIRVQAGKLTDVTVTHRAAVITLKLISDRGGEALANTAWSVLTPGGDVIKESIGAFPRVILAEGDYRVIARNEGKVFE